jgi:RHS repeat-associated protein
VTTRGNSLAVAAPRGLPDDSAHGDPADALGRRILDVKFVDYGGSVPTHPEFDRAHLYYSDRWQVVEEVTEVTAGGSMAPIVTTVNTQVWSPGYVDDLVLRDQSVTIDDPENGPSTTLERLYAQHDHNFNVTSLSDTSGGVTDRVLYDPYGAWTATDPSYANASPERLAGKDWIYLHQGGRYNHVTSLCHFRHRDYAAGLGRWLQPDPAGYVDGASLYQAVGSGPTSWVDPMGLSRDSGPVGPDGQPLNVEPPYPGGEWVQDPDCDAPNGTWKPDPGYQDRHGYRPPRLQWDPSGNHWDLAKERPMGGKLPHGKKRIDPNTGKPLAKPEAHDSSRPRPADGTPHLIPERQQPQLPAPDPSLPGPGHPMILTPEQQKVLLEESKKALTIGGLIMLIVTAPIWGYGMVQSDPPPKGTPTQP